MRFRFKRTIGKKGTETNSRTVFLVEKKTVFADSSKAGKRSNFFMGISSAIVPTILIHALRCTYRNIFIPVFFKYESALQKRAVDKGVHGSVMVKI